MADTVDTLLVDVRASTQGFAQDIAQMRGAFDGTLLSGFEQAGNVLERGLVGAIRRGSLGFEDLRRIALNVINDIAAQAVQTLLNSMGGLGGGSGGGGGFGGLFNFGSLLGNVLGFPGRAIGGSVSPGRGYLVGERGPELFVPTQAGRIDNGSGSSPSREVRIAINVNAPSSPAASQALQRSSRQVASAVRRALRDF
ncbi:tail tape measure protein [Novosphingobium sp.]|uniref:tail tape measure protein n=1 Tax=Novosphingobium sp. TaxID=1874826 RepID=UPI00286D6ABA|nr:tail tape measure protein [Novosphingobium sp.]